MGRLTDPAAAALSPFPMKGNRSSQPLMSSANPELVDAKNIAPRVTTTQGGRGQSAWRSANFRQRSTRQPGSRRMGPGIRRTQRWFLAAFAAASTCLRVRRWSAGGSAPNL